MLRVAINGYGRIGRSVLRALYESGARDWVQVVAINEPADCKTIAHLTRYDSTHGRFTGTVEVQDQLLTVNGDPIQILHGDQLDQLPWRALDVDVVLECSGSFSDRATAEQHLSSGAKRVLFSQPAEPTVDATIVYGVNHQILTGRETVISAASCSTNCVVPVIKVLNDTFGIDGGVITTIHSAMNDQPVIDAYHNTDLRKTRAAMQSIIPVDTGLALGIDRLMPELTGRFQAQAMRVPTINVSAIDLSVMVNSDVDVASINQTLAAAAEGSLNGVLGYTEEPLASCDFNHDPRSGIVDASQTRVSQKKLVKVLIWFDNEWGYANRMLDTLLSWSHRSATTHS
ncbi:MAG: type I glyceraldehyde-3-phosphate dehydrogenase [Porticoccaceae bacterium]|jgi:D-erythrose 4-phosphate dehydrogenase|nr:type I glyceraldehyde-3-phosphate dehydrogenase [Porticoccaceae bacterium]MBT5577826.1 type I glyceraldehyde-3-phosphate dehydrogenase [Porticoccaceae bacterium]MBT7375950.1 type I glyceraldehyde-3-phosphate dehydrogenase [Porticoccaceae bacterium]